ncbi:hypothetical protein RJ641_025141 [Dillenia turbinata]|uniref:Phthiocerol/phthiodiolone dimycocerosyl transferase C-terminal domain-containing protein n=1 Tax=Dillenia turbinata TaxID=194707 RepID=A0AAN8ZJT3_9MAGN
MSEFEAGARPLGGTEHSWCRAVPGGTGITVLAILLSRRPNFPVLQNALQELQDAHPILSSKLHPSRTTGTFSFIPSSDPHVQIERISLSSTEDILKIPKQSPSLFPFHLIIEHEFARNPWAEPEFSEAQLIFATAYELPDDKWAVVLRLHTGACDRTASAGLLREVLRLMADGVTDGEIGSKVEGSLGTIEEYVPAGKANKPFWARGKDMIGYSLNSFRLANLNFVDVEQPRSSQWVRLKFNPEVTNQFVSCCKSREIKLCGVLAAAGLIAARALKCIPNDQTSEKYAVVTLVDCRSELDPPLHANSVGFYHSAILNTHDIRGGEKLWELAKRCYMSFADAKKWNKHFTDMSDLNFLMCRAIENPGLTPSSSLRTSFISVFEDPIIDESNEKLKEIGLEDYVGCASAHGVGPSLAIFDTIRDGSLDCACVYPAPLHSREQMQELVDNMERIIVDGLNA